VEKVGQEAVLEGWKDGSRNLHEERGAVAFPLVLLPLLCVGMAPVVLEVLVVLRVRDEEDQTASLVSESAHLLVGQDHVTGGHLLLAAS